MEKTLPQLFEATWKDCFARIQRVMDYYSGEYREDQLKQQCKKSIPKIVMHKTLQRRLTKLEQDYMKQRMDHDNTITLLIDTTMMLKQPNARLDTIRENLDWIERNIQWWRFNAIVKKYKDFVKKYKLPKRSVDKLCTHREMAMRIDWTKLLIEEKYSLQKINDNLDKLDKCWSMRFAAPR